MSPGSLTHNWPLCCVMWPAFFFLHAPGGEESPGFKWQQVLSFSLFHSSAVPERAAAFLKAALGKVASSTFSAEESLASILNTFPLDGVLTFMNYEKAKMLAGWKERWYRFAFETFSLV